MRLRVPGGACQACGSSPYQRVSYNRNGLSRGKKSQAAREKDQHRRTWGPHGPHCSIDIDWPRRHSHRLENGGSDPASESISVHFVYPKPLKG
jgi:hypothetical protein